MTGRLARVARDPLPQTILGRGLFSSRPKVVSAALHQTKWPYALSGSSKCPHAPEARTSVLAHNDAGKSRRRKGDAE